MLRPLFEHLTALQTCEAILSAAVIVLAFQPCAFARGPAWHAGGRWLVLVYVVALAAFWVWLWQSVATAVPLPTQARSEGSASSAALPCSWPPPADWWR